MTNETIDGARGIEQTNDGRANQAIIIESGKAVAAVAICAAFAGIAASIAVWSVMRFNEMERSYETQSAKIATEYRVVLNHYMELEAQVKEMRNGK